MKKYLIFLILILSHFSVYAEGVKLDCAPKQPSCENCLKYQTLFPIEEFSKELNSLDIEADKSEILNKTYHLTGDAKVTSDVLVLLADDIKVNSTDNITTASGNVRFQDQSFLVTSDELIANTNGGMVTATATNANYQDFKSGIGGANGYTKLITKTDSLVLLTNSTYSLCPVNKNDWLIDAEEIELNFETNRGTAKKAKVMFYGVPIFYAPKYSFVLEGRGSGFLAPDINRYKETGKNKNELGLRIPYYFNISPDQDLLLALNYMSSRGLIYEGKYRKLIAPKKTPDSSNSILSIVTKYLPKDKITNLKRWLVKLSLEDDLTTNTHLSSKYHRVSDSNYFNEISRTDTDLTRLESNIKLSYDDQDSFTADIFIEKDQLVNNGVPEYIKALETSISKSFSQNKTRPKIKLDFIGTKFAHETLSFQKGVRSYGEIEISRKIKPWSNKLLIPAITPRFNASVTNYSLKNNSNINRTILGSGLDVDFTVNNSRVLFGKEVNQRISPIISYNFRQKKPQGNIPIFDTLDRYDSIITFKDLTSGKRYTGLDRISNANDITLSLETSFRDKDGFKDSKKKDLLNMRIAQSYFSDKEVVSDNVSDSKIINYETRKTFSDVAASIDLSFGKYILSFNTQYNPKLSKIVKNVNSISYTVNPRKFITLSSKDEGNLKKNTQKIAGAYPLSSNIHLFGGIEKTSSTGIINSETTGIAYESCCWAFRLAHFKEANSIGVNNYSTGMELVLTGLGSTSSPLNGRIEKKVPGYISELSYD